MDCNTLLNDLTSLLFSFVTIKQFVIMIMNEDQMIINEMERTQDEIEVKLKKKKKTVLHSIPFFICFFLPYSENEMVCI